MKSDLAALPSPLPQVKLTCLSCRAPLTASNSVAIGAGSGGGKACGGGDSGAGAGAGGATSGSLCVHCAHKEPEIYARSLAAVNALEQQFGGWPGGGVCGRGEPYGGRAIATGPRGQISPGCRIGWRVCSVSGAPQVASATHVMHGIGTLPRGS